MPWKFHRFHRSFIIRKGGVFMSRQLQSIYAEQIREFIALKRKLGYKFKVGADFLGRLDRFAYDNNESSEGITKEFADKWQQRNPNESYGYWYDRIRHLALFSTYLSDLGIDSYVPRLPKYRRNSFIPYIFTHDQIKILFDTIDATVGSKTASHSCKLFSMPVLFRTLYGTGIRVSEAVSLKITDVNIEEGYIRVSKSKNGKERVIPISESLRSVCQEYKEFRGYLSRQKTESDWFFISPNGEQCDIRVVRSWFKKCMKQLTDEARSTARVHDLRHTFAVHSMCQMVESGMDLYATLPVLSNYLGHNSIGATNHYVRLTSSMFPKLIKDFDKVCFDMFPLKS